MYRTEDAVSGLLPECKTNIVIGVDETAAGSLYEIDKVDSKPNTSWLLDTGTKLGWQRKLWKDPITLAPTKDDYYEPYMLRLDYGTQRLCAAGLDYPASHGKKTIDVAKCGSTWDADPGACPSASIEVKEVKEHWAVLDTRECEALGEHFLCFCVTRDQDGSGGDVSQGEFCFARGVGKVSEKTDLLEQLVAFCVDGPTCPDPPDVEDVAGCMDSQ